MSFATILTKTYNSDAMRTDVMELFDPTKIAQKYISLYNSI